MVFTQGTPVLPTGISAWRSYFYKLLFTCVRRLRVHWKEWTKNDIKNHLESHLTTIWLITLTCLLKHLLCIVQPNCYWNIFQMYNCKLQLYYFKVPKIQLRKINSRSAFAWIILIKWVFLVCFKFGCDINLESNKHELYEDQSDKIYWVFQMIYKC